ncbi:MAG: hypothetical protein E6J61_03375 [Deltaproteobacteria bacterium]|nr:MAG: hypothetical protein E6J61_03375 [Deltaproteobacteria bacterium]
MPKSASATPQRMEEPEKRGYRQRAGEISCRIDQGGARLAREERVGAPGGPRRGHGERGEQGGGASRRHRQRDQPDQGEKEAGEGLQAGPLAADHARADHGELHRPEEDQGTDARGQSHVREGKSHRIEEQRGRRAPRAAQPAAGQDGEQDRAAAEADGGEPRRIDRSRPERRAAEQRVGGEADQRQGGEARDARRRERDGGC